MKKQCIQCGHLNEPWEVMCVNCPSDLLQAQEVFESAAESPDVSANEGRGSDAESDPDPTIGSASRNTEQPPCDCPAPGGDSGATCFACGGLIGNEQWASTASQSKSDASSQLLVMLPNGVRKELVAGVFLGRDLAHAGQQTASALGSLMGVSRSHAWLCSSGNGVIVVDLGSRNGTWLGTERLQPWTSRFIDDTDLPVEIRLGARGLIQIMAEKSK